MENRSAQHHKDRMAEAIKEELASIVTGELNDPRIGLITVNEVAIAAGGKSARIFVSVAGEERERRSALAALNDAVGFIRYRLAEALNLRAAPDLHFVLDTSGEYASRIDELLERIGKQKRKPRR